MERITTSVGIEPNEARIRERFDRSLMPATALRPQIGYEKASRISLQARREGAPRPGLLTAEQLDEWALPEDMTQPLALPSVQQR